MNIELKFTLNYDYNFFVSAWPETWKLTVDKIFIKFRVWRSLIDWSKLAIIFKAQWLTNGRE